MKTLPADITKHSLDGKLRDLNGSGGGSGPKITKQSPDDKPRDPNGSGGGSGSKGGGGRNGGNSGSGGSGGRNGGNPGSGGSGGRNGGNPGSGGSGGRGSGSGPGKSGAGAGSTGAFQNNLNQNNLIGSYNSTNPNQPLLKTGHQQQIGGVAISNPNAILLNLNSSLYDLTADACILQKKAPSIP
ncbi:hypothetical protein BGZ92_005594 [Podila epicladia]|nr:hypothetical protein BGZ92_005594 [Podila epicladia]